MVKPIYEFIVWDNCSNNCTFCWQKQHYNCLNVEQQIQSLCLVKEKLNNIQDNSYHVLLVGGELFDIKNSAVCNMLIDVFKDIKHKMDLNIVEFLYVNTNLLNTNIQLLDKFLTIFTGSYNKLKFTTSYDKKGRFLTLDAEKKWQELICNIKTKHKDLDIVVNVILTNEVCQQIINNEFDPVFEFDKLKCKVNLIPYVAVYQKLTPTRNIVFSALKQLEISHQEFIEAYVKDMNLNQQRHIYKYANGKLEYASAKNNICGHCENFSLYSVTDKSCFICDLNTIFQAYL